MNDADAEAESTDVGAGNTDARLDALDVGADTLLALAALAAVDAIVLEVVAVPSELRVAAGLLGLVVLPGYALTTAVFPARSPGRFAARLGGGEFGWAADGPAGITDVERAALSFGLSVALMPVFGTLVATLEPADAGFTTETGVAVVTAITVVELLVGAIRRLRAPADARFALPLRGGGRRAWGLVDAGGVDAAINLALVGGVVVATAGFGAALVAPQDGSAYTDVALYTETEDGELVSADLPTEIERGERAPVVLSISNHEQEPADYTVVAELHRLDDDGTVVETASLDSFEASVPAGERERIDHAVEPTLVGDDLRVTYMVYRETPPAYPSTETAYRHVTMWTNVTAPEQPAFAEGTA